jgi:RTX calcium-binding nonapeptide repeat (4 copies)
MATTVDYLTASEKFFNQIGVSGDVNSASVSFNKYLAEQTTAGARSAAIAIAQIAESLGSIIKEIPVLGNIINVAALTNDTNALYATINSNGVTNDKVSAVIGDLFALSAVASITLGSAALPLFIGLSTLSLTASFYSTHAGIINDQQNATLLRWATDSIKELNELSNSEWAGYQQTIYQEFFKEIPAMMPTLLVLHLFDSGITPGEALSFVENSGISNFTDGRIPEISNFIQSLSRIVLGIETSPVAAPQDVNARINALWNNFKTSPLAGNADFVDINAIPLNASYVRIDFGSFLSLYHLAPFAIKPLTPQAEQSLKDTHANISFQWESDKLLTPEQIANGEAAFSDQWIKDRLEMLNMIHASNALDSETVQGSGTAKHYYDFATSTGVHLTGGGDEQQYIFGNDTDNGAIAGLGGDDHLYGGAGNDTLTGNNGNDNLIGGNGNDTYIYTSGDGFDAIVDLKAA